jgi:hypothetical protein
MYSFSGSIIGNQSDMGIATGLHLELYMVVNRFNPDKTITMTGFCVYCVGWS